MKAHSINIRVDDKLKNAIDKAAEANGLPVATYIKSELTKKMKELKFLK